MIEFNIDNGIALFLCVLVVMSGILTWNQQINWDEFYYLYQVYEHQQGNLNRPINTFHVHLFAWLTSIPGNSIDQIQVGRMVMWLCQLGTLAGLFVLSRDFSDSLSARFAVLVYFSFTFVLLFGAQFRADPLALFFAILSLSILHFSSLRTIHIVCFGILAGLGAAISVKLIFLTPAFIGVGLWKCVNQSQPVYMLGRITVAGVAAISLFALLFLFHQSSLAGPGLVTAENMLSDAYTTTISTAGFFPRLGLFVSAFKASPLSLLIYTYAIILSPLILRHKTGLNLQFIIIGMTAPLLSFLFYRNAFPYFYPFILSTSVILIAIFVANFKDQKIILFAVSLGLMVFGIKDFSYQIKNGQTAQRVYVDVIDGLFDESVHYIDHSFVSNKHKPVAFFMTTWGVKKYRAKGQPIFTSILNSKVVPLLFLNRSVLKSAFDPVINSNSAYQLLEADQEVLRENYVQLWGDIYVAGKVISLKDGTPKKIDILIPGRYRIRSNYPVVINGTIYAAEDVIDLTRGKNLVSIDQGGDFMLVWEEINKVTKQNILDQNFYHPQ